MIKDKKKQRKPRQASLPILRPNAAGIDIGAVEIFVALPPGRSADGHDVRSFETFTQDLYALAKWLKENDIDSVAMESTGVYWIPLFQILEAQGFEVFLVNARHVKNVSGRKSDVQDCQWLQYLHSVGLLTASYRPSASVCAIRTYLRHRSSLVQQSAKHIQHMQKAYEQMNLKLHHVISDITGVTGLDITDAILSGERDPRVLASLRNRRIKASPKVIEKSLVGDYLPEHLFTLKQSLEAFRYYQHLIAEVDQQIHCALENFESSIDTDESRAEKKHHSPKRGGLEDELTRIFGVNLARIPGLGLATIQTILAEVGPDFTKFRSPAAFASWLCLCPNNNVSGGKVLSRDTRKTKSRAAVALRMAATSMHRDQSWLGNLFRRLRARLGPPKAITATAHRIARLIYHLVTTKQEYDESCYAVHELKEQKRKLKKLRANAKLLGYNLTPQSA
jgi:transposase